MIPERTGLVRTFNASLESFLRTFMAGNTTLKVRPLASHSTSRQVRHLPLCSRQTPSRSRADCLEPDPILPDVLSRGGIECPAAHRTTNRRQCRPAP